MRRPDILIVNGRAYSWRRLCELRKAQLARWQAAQPVQPTLFDLKNDSRPSAERTASGRHSEPTLLAWLNEQ